MHGQAFVLIFTVILAMIVLVSKRGDNWIGAYGGGFRNIARSGKTFSLSVRNAVTQIKLVGNIKVDLTTIGAGLKRLAPTATKSELDNAVSKIADDVAEEFTKAGVPNATKETVMNILKNHSEYTKLRNSFATDDGFTSVRTLLDNPNATVSDLQNLVSTIKTQNPSITKGIDWDIKVAIEKRFDVANSPSAKKAVEDFYTKLGLRPDGLPKSFWNDYILANYKKIIAVGGVALGALIIHNEVRDAINGYNKGNNGGGSSPGGSSGDEGAPSGGFGDPLSPLTYIPIIIVAVLCVVLIGGGVALYFVMQ